MTGLILAILLAAILWSIENRAPVMTLVDFICPECGHVEHQPSTARNVHRRCPATGRTEAYQRDPDQLVREASEGPGGDPFSGFPKEGQP